jgi:hypothetical protein
LTEGRFHCAISLARGASSSLRCRWLPRTCREPTQSSL